MRELFSRFPVSLKAWWKVPILIVAVFAVLGVVGWQQLSSRYMQTAVTTASSIVSITSKTSVSVSTAQPNVTLLLPGQVVRHPPTDSNPYSWYSYYPRTASGKDKIVICVWPHGGGTPSENYTDHEMRAANQFGWLRRHSEQYQMPVVVVAMPRVKRLYVHSLHPETFTTKEEMLRRPDLKLIDAVWNQYIPLMRKASLDVDEKVLMMGYSSVGMFAHRFTMLHPAKVMAVWLGGEAPAPLPASELDGQPLDYPLGVRNLRELTGQPFDFETYRRIPHFICVGENDANPQNDTTTYTDIFTDQQRLLIRSRFGATNPERIRFFYEYLRQAGVPAEFQLYSGIGHQFTDQLATDAFNFLKAKSA